MAPEGFEFRVLGSQHCSFRVSSLDRVRPCIRWNLERMQMRRGYQCTHAAMQ